jgi:hypothetical protein
MTRQPGARPTNQHSSHSAYQDFFTVEEVATCPWSG